MQINNIDSLGFGGVIYSRFSKLNNEQKEITESIIKELKSENTRDSKGFTLYDRIKNDEYNLYFSKGNGNNNVRLDLVNNNPKWFQNDEIYMESVSADDVCNVNEKINRQRRISKIADAALIAFAIGSILFYLTVAFPKFKSLAKILGMAPTPDMIKPQNKNVSNAIEFKYLG